MTAIELSKKGNIVTIYADKFPKFGEKDYKNKFASQVDDGLWLPYGYDMSNRLRHELLAKLSYDYYKDCYKNKKYSSFKVQEVYERDSTIEALKQKIPAFLYNNYKIANVDLGNGAFEQYIKFKTIKIDTELFIEELRV